MWNICINTKTDDLNIKLGEKYELFEHYLDNLVWVKVGDKIRQAYESDFKSLEKIREEKINNILR